MSRASSPDSLFSEGDVSPEPEREPEPVPASTACPPIPGLWIFPALIAGEVAQDALGAISDADHFVGGTRDQVMLFARPGSSESLPEHITRLLSHLRSALRSVFPSETMEMVFDQPLGRQVILNLYAPGQGISSHIDLPHRYADGILGVSLVGGASMEFTHSTKGCHRVYLPPRSVYILTGQARWEWAHGIPYTAEDAVQREDGSRETILRDVRVSVTYRWMRDGGDVLY